MGESQTQAELEQEAVIRPTFNGDIRVEERPERLSADAGALMMREVMERTGLIDWIDGRFNDPRRSDQITHSVSELMRTQLLLLAQGWSSADDADNLRKDPALRLSVSDRRQDVALRTPSTSRTSDGLASQPTLSRLLAAAADPENLKVLKEASLRCVQQHCRWLDGRQRYTRLTLDLDSLPIVVHGQQAGAVYNGYYQATCYHPLVLGSAELGYLFGAILRPGNAHTADGAATTRGSGVAATSASRTNWPAARRRVRSTFRPCRARCETTWSGPVGRIAASGPRAAICRFVLQLYRLYMLGRCFVRPTDVCICMRCLLSVTCILFRFLLSVICFQDTPPSCLMRVPHIICFCLM